jgi:protein-S-isoprenylcysteine O-methyltransferase Ste14
VLIERLLLPVVLVVFALLALVLPAVRLRRRLGITGVTFHRTAAPAQRLVGALMAASLLAIAGFVALYAALGPGAVGAAAPAVPRTLLGLAVIAGGLAVVVVAQAHLRESWRIGIDDRPTALVTDGIYRHVRNPIYAGIFLALAGVGVVAPSPAFVAIALAVVATVGVQVRLEERHLADQHGAAFHAWAARTGRFLPRPRW